MKKPIKYYLEYLALLLKQARKCSRPFLLCLVIIEFIFSLASCSIEQIIDGVDSSLFSSNLFYETTARRRRELNSEEDIVLGMLELSRSEFSEKFEYKYDSVNDGIQIITYNGKDSSISLDTGLPNLPVTDIAQNCFKNYDFIVNVDLGEGLVRIGEEAFAGCTSLTSIQIPEGTNSAGRDIFAGCTSLVFVSLPSSMRVVSWGAFRDCTALTIVKLADGITMITGDVFLNCTSLTNIDIPSSLTAIATSTFNGCTSIPKELKTKILDINKNAFD